MYDANQLNGQLNGSVSSWPVDLDTALLARSNGAANGHSHGFALLPALATPTERKQ